MASNDDDRSEPYGSDIKRAEEDMVRYSGYQQREPWLSRKLDPSYNREMGELMQSAAERGMYWRRARKRAQEYDKSMSERVSSRRKKR